MSKQTSDKWPDQPVRSYIGLIVLCALTLVIIVLAFVSWMVEVPVYILTKWHTAVTEWGCPDLDE
jgi:hypothetical protein